jgi:hypothetical protein
MKWILTILGVLLLIAGTVWILQGVGIYPVGFMAHQIKYAYYGILLDVIAIGVIIFANRRRKKLPPSS